MRFTLIMLLLLASLTAFSQEKTPDQIEQEKKFQDQAAKAVKDSAKVYGWKHSVVTALNLTQISFKDWAGGGENALSYTLALAGNSVQDMELTNWMNSYRLAFGQTRIASQGLRKMDDEIYMESLLIYKFGLYINPYAAATLRTQFAKGYAYDNLGNSAVISKFFDPGYLTQSVGVAYKPMPEITTRIGVGVREAFASDFAPLYTDDPLTAGLEKVRINGGAESVTDINWNFAENMLLVSRFEVFVPFSDPARTTLRSDNSISAKINKYVTSSVNLTLISDPHVTPYTQIKQVLSLGLSYTLL